MSGVRKIKSALVSVFYKEGLEPLIYKLNELGVEIYSTGGTESFIKNLGVPVKAVEDVTSYPSILGGRVKTLHPKIFGGILARRQDEKDVLQVAEYDIPSIDLVIVDLYPFEETVAAGKSEEDIIEKIDIGGISLIRGAAKNFEDVVVVPSRDYYTEFLNLLETGKGETKKEERKRFAGYAFDISSHYDSMIYQFFDERNNSFKLSYRKNKVLRYGENPHQQGSFYGNLDSFFDQLHGKELSYNNLLDVDAAVNLMNDFDPAEGSHMAVLKHNNVCGMASRSSLLEAWKDALAGDPVSAFGGVIIASEKINLETAEEISKLFFEVLIAPDFDENALKILKQKKNRILLKQKENSLPKLSVRTALNGVLVQEKDAVTDKLVDLKVVTKLSPTNDVKADMVFANKLVKHTKSNAIILAKNKQLLASGVGQTSRVDALKQAIHKAKTFGFKLDGAVMASDAFFPFPDCVELADNDGIRAVVQPGGSIKDQESIDYCDANEMVMVTTGTRHFKH